MGITYHSVTDTEEIEEFTPYYVNGYLISEPLVTTGGGNCKWTIAEKYGKKFFLKEFLTPKFPSFSAEISEEMRRTQVQECEEWVNEHQNVYNAVKSCNCGGLVVPLDFFRDKNNFYLVTEVIENSKIRWEELCGASEEQKLLIMKVLAYNIASLARVHVVHSDLKPDNLLLKSTVAPYYTVKIIDFDASFLEDVPPEPEEMTGDTVYFSPEAIYYQISEGGCTVTPKSDVFSLGIIFHQILCGELPSVEEQFESIGEAILNGQTATLHTQIAVPFQALLRRMLERDPDNRISAEEVLQEIVWIEKPSLRSRAEVETESESKSLVTSS